MITIHNIRCFSNCITIEFKTDVEKHSQIFIANLTFEQLLHLNAQQILDLAWKIVKPRFEMWKISNTTNPMDP